MNLVSLNFSLTTAEEQKYYFSGEVQNNDMFEFKEALLSPGNYRIIDGRLCQVITGASPDTIKAHFESIRETKK